LETERESSSPYQNSLWPLALLGILVSSLALIASKRNQPFEPGHRQQAPDHEGKGGKVEVGIVSKIPPPPPQQQHTNGSKDPTPPWKKVAEIVVAVSTIGLLIGSICQSRAMRDQLKEMQALHPAPFVAIDENKFAGNIVFVGGYPMLDASYSVMNYGAAIAINATDGAVFLSGNGGRPDLSDFSLRASSLSISNSDG
jgi:hypothetical protein